MVRTRRVAAWSANGRWLGEGTLDYGDEPAFNTVHVIRLEAETEDRARAELDLVVIPRSTEIAFRRWLLEERKDMAWIERLPPVYSSLAADGLNPEPGGCNPRFWPSIRRVDTKYHPGAAWELRSVTAQDGSGHQAIYDVTGKLIRTTVAAGSADRVSPGFDLTFSRLRRHVDRDITPYVWAAQLDGNPVNPTPFFRDLDRPLIHQGRHLDQYLEVRPAFGPDRREFPPGVCISPK